ncbi:MULTISPECIES: PfkB family carbohydrate kinase [unclassified Amycolatopsis]|uniref:PfkB family carbohydrate kinase n=1 Tax=unclassified Amycolatopsis TaxID=2618356 RepID=UPI00287521F8|nr:MULTISPECIES: PfkB family carbohydrate kinase [unclassified Amycolatopsis]MDS0133907.1 sugar kinase [Amycolatopsis sp. 505]MDS0144783.1 sugar kinase [Amycolatopsis sp. CM201R]
MTGRLVHTGQVVVDLVMAVPALPPVGGDVLASSTNLLPGGGFNVMSAAARSGARVLYAGSHGIGRFGDLVRSALVAEGVALAHDPVSEMDTGVVVVLVDATGERTFATGTGAEGRLSAELLTRVTPKNDDVVYVSGYSWLHEINRGALIEWLPRLPGSKILFDPGPLITDIDPGDIHDLLSTVDILSCTAREAEVLGELPPVAVVREGAKGCRVHENGRITDVPGYPVDVVDTTGAGDTHCGVLAAELLRGSTVLDAAVRANAAAALSVTRRGPATAPGREEIDQLVEAMR